MKSEHFLSAKKMELKVQGNPGQGNSFNDVTVDGGSYNPNAKNVYHYYSVSGLSRMGTYFQRLMEEIQKNVTDDIIEDLLFYKTKLDGTKDVEEKLSDGGFQQSKIQEAVRLKEMYAKKALLYDCYPSAQKINLTLFARIKHEFDDTIFPLIKQGQPLAVVMQQIRMKIVIPIMELIEENGAHDEYLNYTEDHIYGMIYYLTGMCHLNWKDYDNL